MYAIALMINCVSGFKHNSMFCANKHIIQQKLIHMYLSVYNPMIMFSYQFAGYDTPPTRIPECCGVRLDKTGVPIGDIRTKTSTECRSVPTPKSRWHRCNVIVFISDSQVAEKCKIHQDVDFKASNEWTDYYSCMLR